MPCAGSTARAEAEAIYYRRGPDRRQCIKSVVSLALLLAASVLAFGASSGPSAEEAIKQLERDRQDAFVRGDIEQLDRDTAAAYSTINSNGKISDKPAMMTNLKAHKTRILSVKLAESNGERKENHARFTRVFVKDGGRWVAVAYQQTAIAEE